MTLGFLPRRRSDGRVARPADERRLDDLLALLKRHGIDAERQVEGEAGDAGGTLLRIAADLRADRRRWAPTVVLACARSSSAAPRARCYAAPAAGAAQLLTGRVQKKPTAAASVSTAERTRFQAASDRPAS